MPSFGIINFSKILINSSFGAFEISDKACMSRYIQINDSFWLKKLKFETTNLEFRQLLLGRNCKIVIFVL